MMRDHQSYIDGLDTLAALYVEHPTLPLGGGIDINLHRYRSQAIDPAEQIRLTVAIVEQMRQPEIRLKLNRGAPTAWLYVTGYVRGLRVDIQMWADEVCERRPNEQLKRDRWVIPPALATAVQAASTGGGEDL
ncbi:hypothetical protein [Nonomuraea endophytica]|uniref:hypothetical protein n=1 Tax=Nonomuraea endophytica TaxID=714136 RepID=UPI0037CB1F57